MLAIEGTINGYQDNEEITAMIRIRNYPDTQHVLIVSPGEDRQSLLVKWSTGCRLSWSEG
mgnify:CR=1 FL=1